MLAGLSFMTVASPGNFIYYFESICLASDLSKGNDEMADRKIIYIDLNPFMPSALFDLNSLDQSIFSLMGVWSVFIMIMFNGNTCN